MISCKLTLNYSVTNQSLFFMILGGSRLKTLCEKEKFLVTIVFLFFSTLISIPSRTNFAILATFKLSSANAFNSGKSNILSFSKLLKYNAQDFSEFFTRHQLKWPILEKEANLVHKYDPI